MPSILTSPIGLQALLAGPQHHAQRGVFDRLDDAVPQGLVVLPFQDNFCQLAVCDGLFITNDGAQAVRLAAAPIYVKVAAHASSFSIRCDVTLLRAPIHNGLHFKLRLRSVAHDHAFTARVCTAKPKRFAMCLTVRNGLQATGEVLLPDFSATRLK